MAFNNFSIVIPAHNEEKYIQETLKRALSQNYPLDRFELIVVENGSTDKTLSKIKQLKSRRLKTYSMKQNGISLAKNFGARKVNKKCEWIIFLDADTWLARNALLKINEHIEKNERAPLSIGTTTLMPIERRLDTDFWFIITEIFARRFFKNAGGVQIANRKIFERIRYDEGMKMAEDVKLIKDMEAYGKFFHVPIVSRSSARRIVRVGTFRLMLECLNIWLYSLERKGKVHYEVIR